MGTPRLTEEEMEARLPARFWAKVQRGADDECWPWIGSRNPAGYGQIWHRRRIRRATHIALHLEGIEIPPGMFACHHCDNPPCVNAGHLFVGTQVENLSDMDSKRRRVSRDQHGERNGAAVLTEPKVVAIRAIYAAGGISHLALGERFGVAAATIGRIVNRETWRDLA